MEEQKDQRAKVEAEQASAVAAAEAAAPVAADHRATTGATVSRSTGTTYGVARHGPRAVPEQVRKGCGRADRIPDWDDDPEDEPDGGGKMSFLEHLDELRRRIIYSVLSLVARRHRSPASSCGSSSTSSWSRCRPRCRPDATRRLSLHRADRRHDALDQDRR